MNIQYRSFLTSPNGKSLGWRSVSMNMLDDFWPTFSPVFHSHISALAKQTAGKGALKG
jgi:hypothetical protein